MSAAAAGLPALADDSGLEVTALGGLPGFTPPIGPNGRRSKAAGARLVHGDGQGRRLLAEQGPTSIAARASFVRWRWRGPMAMPMFTKAPRRSIDLRRAG